MLRRQSTRLNFLLLIVIFCFMFVVITKLKETPHPENFISLTDSNSNELYTSNKMYESANKNVKTSSKRLSLKDLIALKNIEQKILNENRLGPITQDTLFITIQVHTRYDYLKSLIESFRNASDIDKTLLIFSHDVYNDEINELIQSIDFAMVLQIFYPYSIQLNPNVFPGTDSKDCGRDVGKEKAMEIDCLNAKYPDTYGHYREAKFTQMKHHWWWKLNRIFDELRFTKHLHDFMLLLIEEDHYVAPDIIYVYKLMRKLVLTECPKCNIIALGTYSEQLDASTYNQIDITPWTTNLHNMGMALSKATWTKVKTCAEHFCNYDEYNYDFSLQNVNRKCLKDKLLTALIRGPRIFHVGECGIHHKSRGSNCDVKDIIKGIDLKLARAKNERTLYPEDLEIGSTNLRHPTNELINNGGWADRRDQCLCLNIANKRSDECSELFTV